MILVTAQQLLSCLVLARANDGAHGLLQVRGTSESARRPAHSAVEAQHTSTQVDLSPRNPVQELAVELHMLANPIACPADFTWYGRFCIDMLFEPKVWHDECHSPGRLDSSPDGPRWVFDISRPRGRCSEGFDCRPLVSNDPKAPARIFCASHEDLYRDIYQLTAISSSRRSAATPLTTARGGPRTGQNGHDHANAFASAAVHSRHGPPPVV